ncbi:MAG: Do family serine endopeptidase [Cytophagales bacterium]|nr:Do family serine endopeptidase [Cytophagales bacterium]
MSFKTSFLQLVLAALLGGIFALVGYRFLGQNTTSTSFQGATGFSISTDSSKVILPEGLNFIYAANVSKPAVVHIKSYFKAPSIPDGGTPSDIFDFFNQDPSNPDFHGRMPREGSGSGVIITADGYIVTNHHVIENAEKIEVILDDRRKYTAKLIGKDPSTDLALLKIEAQDLPFLRFGSSDKLQLGEWVLAVGNPLDLISTITAGIVSAKARNINLLRTRDNLQVESFIQTDAAVNPGNSGGALVNLKGELVGINTAIASQTGGYSGYSFAVPSSMVKKVMDDLLKHGEVQRGLLGVNIQDMDASLTEKAGLSNIRGVYVAGVNEGSAAGSSGIEPGDVILKINGEDVNSAAQLQEKVARYRPGDKVKVTFYRNKKEMTAVATLKNKLGTTNIIKTNDHELVELVGADVVEISAEEKAEFGLVSGLKVIKLYKGKFQRAGIRRGFIITHVGQKPVPSPQELSDFLKGYKGGLLVEGVYPDGERAYYAVGF